jgi:hypothetical protein
MGTPGYLGSNSPRLWFRLCGDQHRPPDTTYANGPTLRATTRSADRHGRVRSPNQLTLKSISGYRQIKWNIGTDLA